MTLPCYPHWGALPGQLALSHLAIMTAFAEKLVCFLSTRLWYLWQWTVLLVCCFPALATVVVLSLPMALALWVTGVDVIGRRLAAKRDPVLARAMQVEAKEHQHPLLFRLAALRLVYTSLVAFGLHSVLRLFVILARPKVVFGVYLSNYNVKRKFFSVGICELLRRARLLKGYMLPETPWAFMLGVIHVDADVGFGVWCGISPCMSHMTSRHLQLLPAALAEEFPHAESIALAGRLPGLMKAAGVPIKAPIVDGLAGTLFAMEASVRTLAQQLPTERQARPTVAILGGGGHIGARLVSVLAPEPAATRGSAFCHMLRLPDGDDEDRAAGDLDCVKHTGPDVDGPKAPAYRQIIALDSRFADNRHSKGGVLYTADPRDLECADVVLVITRCGDDAAGYVQHARPGQVWGDDTHPEMSASLLQQLRARGVSVHKVMATRNPPSPIVPPLDGWPMGGTPGCLLMALVSAATGRDWNNAGTSLVAGKLAKDDPYHMFAAATHTLGFHAMLAHHRRSRMDRDGNKDV